MSDELEMAVRAGCNAADVHLTCNYPTCACKQMPTAIRAALSTAAAMPIAKLDEIIEFAEANAAAAVRDTKAWRAHARNCRDVRAMLFAAPFLPAGEFK